MKNVVQFLAGILFFVLATVPGQAAFSSLYVFGDGLSATDDTNYPAPGTAAYYGLRWSNGRVWVEVLAQRQGLTLFTNHNFSYFDHNSASSVTDVKNFNAPSDITNDLFIVWVCNADTFDAAQVPDTSNQWVTANMVSQTNHFQIITNLYAKGVRTLMLPNAVDISKIPDFNKSSHTNDMRNGCIDFNGRFTNTISQAAALCPGLTIYEPNFFNLLNDVLTNAAFYGLTNALKNGLSIDAFSDPAISTLNTNGQGTNYIFWDPDSPTSKFHEVIADVAQQIISPVQIGKIVSLNGSNRLDLANVPIGLNGSVAASTNVALPLASWTNTASITSTNNAQSVFVPVSGPQQFYRLRFPYAWSWP